MREGDAGGGKMACDKALIELFTAQSVAVNSTVVTAKNFAGAAEYALNLCAENEFARNGARAGEKIFAAPDVPPELFERLAATGAERGVTVVGGGLRGLAGGVDVGFTRADMGIADTGTAVMRCFSEDARLAGMLCETHVLALPASRIVASSREAGAFLREALAGPMYVAFVSGCSRTSDIERVLTLGVHGPLALHIVLMEEE